METTERGFKVRLVQQIHANHSTASSEDIWVARVVTMPHGLQPFPGLRVEWQDDGMEHAESAKLDEIVLRANGEISSYVGEDRELYEFQLYNKAWDGNQRDRMKQRLRGIVDELRENGWSFDKERDAEKYGRLPEPAITEEELRR